MKKVSDILKGIREGAVPSTEKTVTVKHKSSGKEIRVTQNSIKTYRALGYHPIKEESELEEGAFSSGKLKPPKEWVDAAKKIPSTGTIRDKDSKGVYTSKTVNGKEVSREYDIKEQLAKHQAVMSKRAIGLGKAVYRPADKLTKEEVVNESETHELAIPHSHPYRHEMIRNILKKHGAKHNGQSDKSTYFKVAADKVHAAKSELKSNGVRADHWINGELKEEVVQEGRPSQRHPLEGHEYHRKTNAELEYIAKDAHKAAEAMKSHNTTAENKYRDQANDSATVRHFRKTSGSPDWYKKKYNLKEETEMENTIEEGAVPSTEKTVALRHKSSGKEIRVTQNSIRAYRSLGYHPIKEESEQIDEADTIYVQHSNGAPQKVKLTPDMKAAGKIYVQHPSGPQTKVKLPKVKEEVEHLNEDETLKAIAKKHDMKYHPGTYGANMSHATKGYVNINRYGEWGHYKQGRFDRGHGLATAHGDSSQHFKDLDKHLATLKEGKFNQMDVDRQDREAAMEKDGWKKTPANVTDKSGAKHSPMSRARDLARAAARKQAGLKEADTCNSPAAETLISLNTNKVTKESRKAGIVRKTLKDAKEKKETKGSADKYDADPELTTQIIRND